MMNIRMLLIVTLASFLANSAMAAGAAKPGVAAETGKSQTALKLAVGRSIHLGGVDVSLNQVVSPGDESLGGQGFTEYNLTFTNTSQDKELILSNAAFFIHNETRAMVKDPDDIVNQGNSAGKNVAANTGAAAAGFVGGLFGPLGSIASMVGVNAAASKIYVDDPQKWREEIKKRGFQGNDAGASIFPAETATGSIWVKQSGSEVASRIQLYIKQGGASRLVKLELEGMPPAKVASKDQ